MGTKSNPGPHDCYQKAEEDEPLFTLLARDPFAPILVSLWASLREQAGEDYRKIADARMCAVSMTRWLRKKSVSPSGDEVKDEAKEDLINE